jgi:hypothetical protein
MTPGAMTALRDSGVPGPFLDAVEKRLAVSSKGSTRARHGPLRDRLHEFLGEEVAYVWSSGRAAKEALDNTVRRVNEAIAPVVPKKAVAKARKK